MTSSPRRLVAWVLAASVLSATVACDVFRNEEEVDGPRAGGTLRVAVAGWPAYLDPQRVTTTTEANLSKLLSRTLTAFRPEPGDAATELVADLATDTGRPSENSTVWEFTLREGARWEDGESVTCQDLKYGVERRYAPERDRQTGSTVPFHYLRDNETPYQGPWDDDGGLAAVECVDDRVIRYHLDKPVGDFNFAVSLPVFAPVRPGADDDLAGYNRAPLATGPYRIVEGGADPAGSEDARLVLERNPYWLPATDQLRPAHPNAIVLEHTDDVEVTTHALVTDEGEDRDRILLDRNVAPTFLQQVAADPELSARVATGPMGSVRYLPINTELVPQVECRRALAYALNKRKARGAVGGELLGELATGMIPPSLPAHLEFDHYGTHEFPDGQPERAREILAEAADAGIVCPEELAFAHPDTVELRRLADVVVDDYQRIGIRVVPDPIPPEDYLTADGVLGEQSWELAWIGLSPAWPNGSAVIPGLFDGRIGGPGSASHLNRLDDDRIHELIDAAFAEADLERQFELWGELDRELMEMAVAVPLMYDHGLRIHGSNVHGAFVHPQLAMPDLTALGLADPALSHPSPQ